MGRDDLEMVEDLLRDIRDEIRTSNEHGARVVQLWEEQREANKITETNNAAQHAETMAHLARSKERDIELRAIDKLNLEVLQRRAEQERRWDDPDKAVGDLRDAVNSLSKAVKP